MLEHIQEEAGIDAFVEGVKKKRHKLMGFGHRVYKKMDPRASIIRLTCHEVLAELGLTHDSKFELAMKLEKIGRPRQIYLGSKKRSYPLRHLSS